LYETLANRGRSYERDSIEDIYRLTENIEIQKRWENFCKKILKYELNFADVVNIIIDFMSPPYNAMIQENELLKVWNSKNRKYF